MTSSNRAYRVYHWSLASLEYIARHMVRRKRVPISSQQLADGEPLLLDAFSTDGSFPLHTTFANIDNWRNSATAEPSFDWFRMQCQMTLSEQNEHLEHVPSSSASSAASSSSAAAAASSSWLLSLSNNAIAGCFAGAGARMVVAPLDLIRIRLQLEPSKTLIEHFK
jgi:Mitochondrial carrier protein